MKKHCDYCGGCEVEQKEDEVIIADSYDLKFEKQNVSICYDCVIKVFDKVLGRKKEIN